MAVDGGKSGLVYWDEADYQDILKFWLKIVSCIQNSLLWKNILDVEYIIGLLWFNVGNVLVFLFGQTLKYIETTTLQKNIHGILSVLVK